MMNKEIAEKHMKQLQENPYPGRGIVLGLTPDGARLVQVYWIMGRSENSRNRVFVEENGFVKTKAFDEAKCTDPSLIIYYPVKHLKDCHIVSNGDQTDTIYQSIVSGSTFEDAIEKRTFEPDAPNYTPRISGIMDLSYAGYAYQLAIIKSMGNDHAFEQKNFFNYRKAVPGFGHCLTTYTGDGNPLPSFSGEPFLVPLKDTEKENADMFWDALDEANKVSLLVKTIDCKTGQCTLAIKNKL